jgi:hypothetical protein
MTENRFSEKRVETKKHEGIKKHEKFLTRICNVEHFSVLPAVEKKGYYAVAMLLAYCDGAKPLLKEFAYHLRVSPSLLEEPFKNLVANGIFSSIYKKKNVDGETLNIGFEWMTKEKRDTVDWCYVAGVGSGLAGLKIEN